MVNLNFLLHCPPAAYLFPVGVLWYMSIGEYWRAAEIPKMHVAPL
jgi:hypothetical protein